MASGVRFTKAERELLTRLLEHAVATLNSDAVLFSSAWQPTDNRTAQSALDKLLKSELVKKKTAPGIGWVRASEAMKGVLGGKLTLPPAPSEQWCIWMNTRIKNLGLTEEHCRTIAQNVSSWRPPISFETLIKGADRYLTSPQVAPQPWKARGNPVAARGPVEADDD